MVRGSRRRNVAAVAGLALVASVAFVAAGGDAAPTDVVSYPACFANPIKVGSQTVYTPAASCSSTTTTTVAATTTTMDMGTTVAPTTTAPTTAPTTAAPSTTTAPTTVAPTSTALPTTTTVEPAGDFMEDFSTEASLQRFDFGWSGQKVADVGEQITTWNGDHDANCGNPATTTRRITISPGDHSQVFYWCDPNGDPTKAHMMTTVQTSQYNIAWFSPKRTFTNVKRVCWDQNLTDLGGGKWTDVMIIPIASVDYYKAHPPTFAIANGQIEQDPIGTLNLGFVDPEFGTADPSTKIVPLADEWGGKFALRGVSRMFQGRGFKNVSIPPAPFGDQTSNLVGNLDHASRYQTCMKDNGNNTVTLTQARPGGTVETFTVAGHFPTGDVRVSFMDDNYDPDKHYNDAGKPPNDHMLTWHWDNLLIQSGG